MYTEFIGVMQDWSGWKRFQLTPTLYHYYSNLRPSIAAAILAHINNSVSGKALAMGNG
jgi:hypothetical protein